jgi:hypothetical protein
MYWLIASSFCLRSALLASKFEKADVASPIITEYLDAEKCQRGKEIIN